MIIETERLVLRPFRESDAADVLEYLAEPAVNCFACMKLHSHEEALEEMKRRSGETEYYFAIVEKASGRVIGEIDGYPERDPHDPTSQGDTFSPCWMLNKAYQGKGYAYEAAHAFLDYLFQRKGARRIYAYVEDYNLPSQRLCEKLGMRREGLFMEFVSFVNNEDGSPHYENTMQYAILKKEWLFCEEATMRLLFELDKGDHSLCTHDFVRPSARAILIRDGRIAMVHSLKYDYYEFPGGGIEKGEDPVQAVIRETLEEAGLTVIPGSVREYGLVRRIQKSPGDPTERFLQDNYYYLCEAEPGQTAQKLDGYEAEERFTPEFVEPEMVIRVNRTGDHGPKDPMTLEREARVMQLLLEEGYFSQSVKATED